MERVFFVRWAVMQNDRPVGRSRGGSKSAVVFARDAADAQAKVMAQEDVGRFRSYAFELYEAKGDVVGVGGFNSLEVVGGK